jgi:hypothetical protein
MRRIRNDELAAQLCTGGALARRHLDRRAGPISVLYVKLRNRMLHAGGCVVTPLAVLLCNADEKRYLAGKPSPENLADNWTIARIEAPRRAHTRGHRSA